MLAKLLIKLTILLTFILELTKYLLCRLLNHPEYLEQHSKILSNLSSLLQNLYKKNKQIYIRRILQTQYYHPQKMPSVYVSLGNSKTLLKTLLHCISYQKFLSNMYLSNNFFVVFLCCNKEQIRSI